jgi:hypothetical protein
MTAQGRLRPAGLVALRDGSRRISLVAMASGGVSCLITEPSLSPRGWEPLKMPHEQPRQLARRPAAPWRFAVASTQAVVAGAVGHKRG